CPWPVYNKNMGANSIHIYVIIKQTITIFGIGFSEFILNTAVKLNWPPCGISIIVFIIHTPQFILQILPIIIELPSYIYYFRKYEFKSFESMITFKIICLR